MQFPCLDECIVQEFCIIELEIARRLDVGDEDGRRILNSPVEGGGAQVVLPDQCFADDVGVGEGGGGVLHYVIEGE